MAWVKHKVPLVNLGFRAVCSLPILINPLHKRCNIAFLCCFDPVLRSWLEVSFLQSSPQRPSLLGSHTPDLYTPTLFTPGPGPRKPGTALLPSQLSSFKLADTKPADPVSLFFFSWRNNDKMSSLFSCLMTDTCGPSWHDMYSFFWEL